MINHFLKLGGVNTVEEFYSKFPTEAHFDNHVHRMKYGGMYAYDEGGPTDPPYELDENDPIYKMQSQIAAAANRQVMPPPEYNNYTIPDAVNRTVSVSRSNIPSISPYGGVSVVDYLASKGKPINKASRKKLAESLGIKNYTGKAGENNRLLKMIKERPEVLDNYQAVKEPVVTAKKSTTPVKKSYTPIKKTTTPVKPTDAGYQPTQAEIDAYMAEENARQARENPYVMARPQQTPPTISKTLPVWPYNQNKPTPKKNQSDNTPASTNNYQRYPGRGTTFELDYNNYEGRPDQVTTTPTKKTDRTVVKKPVTKTTPMVTPFDNIKWLNDFKKQYGLDPNSKVIKGTAADARYIESGMIEDKNKGVMHVVVKGKVVKTFPIMTGSNKDGEINNLTLAELEKLEKTDPAAAKKLRATPRGTYISTPTTMYNQAGFNMTPIPAFGEPAPLAKDLAQHVIYPGEYEKRMKIMKGSGEQRVGSYGCTNMYGQDIDCLTGQIFPGGDTTIVVDSRIPKDQAFLKNKYNVQKMGGEPCYECGGMYEHGGYYGNVPQHGRPGTYADGYSGTSSGGQYFSFGGDILRGFGQGMRDGSLQGLAGAVAGMGANTGISGGITSPIKNMNDKSGNLKTDLTTYLSSAGTNLDAKAIQDIVNKYAAGGAFIPVQSMAGQLPKYGYGKAMYGMGMAYGGMYADGGMSPEEQAMMMAQQQGQQQAPPQQGGGIDPQQVMQQVAEMLQQGMPPEQIMQQLVEIGIPQEQAQQIIQQVMQQMQGQQQGGQEEMMQGPQKQEVPQQGQPMQEYGGSRNSNFAVGGEYDVNENDVQQLIAQGYKIQYI